MSQDGHSYSVTYKVGTVYQKLKEKIFWVDNLNTYVILALYKQSWPIILWNSGKYYFRWADKCRVHKKEIVNKYVSILSLK